MSNKSDHITVDVLAVLSDASQHMERDGYTDIPYDLALAHVAVAELIAATEALVESGDEGADHGSVANLRWSAAKVRVAVALARCKGEQA